MPNLQEFGIYIGIFAGIASIATIIVSYLKYKPAVVSVKEIEVVSELLDSIRNNEFYISYHKNDFEDIGNIRVRKIFSPYGHLIQLKEKIENKVDRSFLSYPVLIQEKQIEYSYLSQFQGNRFVPRSVRNVLKEITFSQYDNDTLTGGTLRVTRNNFCLIEIDYDLLLLYGYGSLPNRIFSIRDFNYVYVQYRNRKMYARDFKKICLRLDKTIHKWLKRRGLLHLYDEKFDKNLDLTTFYENVKELIRNTSVDSGDICLVTKGSPIHKEIENLM